MTTHRVFAYALLSHVPAQKLAEELGLEVLLGDRKRVLLRGADCFVVAHNFGAIVFVGEVGALEAEALAKFAATGPRPLREPTTEDFEIVVEPGAELVTQFERVVVPELSPALVDLIALVVGQSVALEHLEIELDQFVARMGEDAGVLRRSGSLKRTRKELLQFIGAGLGLSNTAMLTLSILDPPIASWDNELLDRAQRGLRHAFGIEERYRALDHKLTKVQDGLELMVDLAHHQRSARLEWIIILLIAFEIVLFAIERWAS